MFAPCFNMHNSLSFHFCNHLDEEERAGCFTLIVSLVSCDCLCSMVLPRCALCRFVVCDCGIC